MGPENWADPTDARRNSWVERWGNFICEQLVGELGEQLVEQLVGEVGDSLKLFEFHMRRLSDLNHSKSIPLILIEYSIK
jgi:hypothetical protein